MLAEALWQLDQLFELVLFGKMVMVAPTINIWEDNLIAKYPSNTIQAQE